MRGNSHFTSLTGIQENTTEDDGQLFIIIKGNVAEYHLLTTAVSTSRREFDTTCCWCGASQVALVVKNLSTNTGDAGHAG